MQVALKVVAGGLAVLALVLSLVGIQKSLPLAVEADEPAFVEPAVRIAATGDLNPRWFGHPGSTVIYPLAAIYRLWAGPDVVAAFEARSADVYLLGRSLSLAYQALCIPLVFLLGRRVFGTTAGIMGAALAAILAIGIAHAQVVRSDSAATFFGLLGLLLVTSVARGGAPPMVALAGATVGLAVGTRYFMLALLPVLLLAIGMRWQGRRRLGLFALACLSATAGFLVSSPFVVLDWPRLTSSLAAEAEGSHLGADGLSPMGNLAWYLGSGLPTNLSVPLALLAGLGIGLAGRARLPLLLATYVALHLMLISVSALHWHRWTIQVLPVLCLFAGYAVTRLPIPPVLGLIVLAIMPLAQVALYATQQAGQPPRLAAREWIAANLPAEAPVATEAYGPPLGGLGVAPFARFALAAGQTLGDYRRAGIRYLAVSSAVYERYLAEPEKYPAEAAFYRELFQREEMLAEFTSPTHPVLAWLAGGECFCSLHPTRGGPAIRIYRLGTGLI